MRGAANRQERTGDGHTNETRAEVGRVGRAHHFDELLGAAGTCAQFLERQSDGVNVLWEPHRTAVTAEWDAVALTAGVLKDQDRRTDWDVDEVAALPFFAVRSFGDGHGLRSCQIWGEGRPCPRWKHLRRQPQAAIMKRGRDALSGPYCCQKSLKCLSHAA